MMEGRAESWLDAASAFQPFYASKELLENNFKGANRLALLGQQMKDLPETQTDVLKEILRKNDSKYADLEMSKDENAASGKNSPVNENHKDDAPSSVSSSDDSDQEEEIEKLVENDDKFEEQAENNQVELKKARVENIITSIQLSPRSNSESQNGVGINESRRKKRKQNQPQQHDVTCVESKYLKMDERSLVQQQLREMQQQLACIQKRYSKLFEDNQSDDEFEPSPLVIDIDGTQPKDTPLHSHTSKKQLLEDSHMTSAELQDLNKSLKSEIVAAVGSAIDSVVKKFIAKAPPKKEEPVKATVVAPKEFSTQTQSHAPPMIPQDLQRKMDTPLERFEETRNRMRTKVSDKHLNNYFEHMAAARAYPLEVPLPFPRFFSPPSLYYPHTQVPLPQPIAPPPKAPEQTEALSLVCPPKKKRTKVTDTRLSPRAARALLQEPVPTRATENTHLNSGDIFPPGIQTSLPTSVAIPNPSLQHSDVLAMYSRGDFSIMDDRCLSSIHSPSMGEKGSPSEARTPTDGMSMSFMKREDDTSSNEGSSLNGHMGTTSTLTPMHLRKAKLMFFYVRYPSSAILKMYFPDIKFNKNNTAQLVKWFSNFREFYYIQMEKYSRSALTEGVQHPEELTVTTDSEIYRVLNLHYNRNNQLDVPDSFRAVVQLTLREFFKSISTGKDAEQSWKKQIYKVIARQDEPVPEYFKSANWMEQLAD